MASYQERKAMDLVLSTLPLDNESQRKLVANPGVTVRVVAAPERTWTLPEEFTHNVVAMMCRRPPENFDQLARLQTMQLTSVGYEHLREWNMAERSVRVCNARGIFDPAIGEWNLTMMVNLLRDLRGMIRNQDTATWERVGRFTEEIRGRTVGLWGYGGIGRETARLAKAFGMTVHTMTRTGVRTRSNTYVQPGTGDPEGVLPDRVFVAGQEREFLAGLDFLVLALPHTKQSDGMIGEKELRTLPPRGFVLNPARGLIIQEQALLRALREGWIAGAAIDTHYVYPLPAEHPLWGMPNVLLTPHVSGSDKSSMFPTRMAELFVENVSRLREEKPLLNELTRQEWLET